MTQYIGTYDDKMYTLRDIYKEYLKKVEDAARNDEPYPTFGKYMDEYYQEVKHDED